MGRARPKARRLDSSPLLRCLVVGMLKERLSPQQVAARLVVDYPGRDDLRVSHETVYQALYVQGRGSLRHELGRAWRLRSGRARRQARSRLAAPLASKPWLEGAHISARPPQAQDRALPGHWEGDLLIGAGGRSAAITLVERSTRYVMVRPLWGPHDSATVAAHLTQMAGALPRELFQTLTWDQGSEMAQVASFTAATGIQVYFCDPHSPWQRGSNENTNGLLREFFPKGTDLYQYTPQEWAHAQHLLNKRPRKTLGWATPAEKLNELLQTHNNKPLALTP